MLENYDALLDTARASVHMLVVIPPFKSLGILDLVNSHAVLNQEGPTW